MALSKRLDTVLRLVPPCETAADIGTDHGFVPIELVRRGIADRAIASDVRSGPLERARQHIGEAGLSDRIDARLGSGLKTLSPGEAEVLILSGMGGLLITELLEEAPEVLGNAETLVLSPHTDWDAVRQCVQEQGFRIADETMTEEDGKFYVFLKCVRGARKRRYTRKELQYGPVLLKKCPEVFMRYLYREREKTANLLEKLRCGNVAQSVLKEKEHMLRMLEEILGSQEA